MEGEPIRVAVIGLGQVGTPLLEALLNHSFVEVAMVADYREGAPGMELARSRGIPATTDFTQVARLQEPADMIIDVSGDRGVKNALRLQLQLLNNTHSIIVPERVALLMLSMVRGELVQGHQGVAGYR